MTDTYAPSPARITEVHRCANPACRGPLTGSFVRIEAGTNGSTVDVDFCQDRCSIEWLVRRELKPEFA